MLVPYTLHGKSLIRVQIRESKCEFGTEGVVQSQHRTVIFIQEVASETKLIGFVDHNHDPC
jgi:hypothetical protein